MPFYCSLCKNEEESCYISAFCTKCLETKKIISLYGIDRVNETLKEVFVRKEDQTKKRTDIITKIGLPQIKPDDSEETDTVAKATRSNKRTGFHG
jgi:hypothetical protein